MGEMETSIDPLTTKVVFQSGALDADSFLVLGAEVYETLGQLFEVELHLALSDEVPLDPALELARAAGTAAGRRRDRRGRPRHREPLRRSLPRRGRRRAARARARRGARADGAAPPRGRLRGAAPAGQTFTLSGHPTFDELGTEYVVISARQRFYVDGAERGSARVELELLPKSVPYRPARVTRKPRIAKLARASFVGADLRASVLTDTPIFEAPTCRARICAALSSSAPPRRALAS